MQHRAGHYKGVQKRALACESAQKDTEACKARKSAQKRAHFSKLLIKNTYMYEMALKVINVNIANPFM